MIFCTCGRRWGGRFKTNVQRAYYQCYTCAKLHWYSQCQSTFSYRQEDLERVIWERVWGLLTDSDSFATEIARRREQSEAGAARYRKRMEAINAALHDNERKMSVLLDQVLTGGFAETVIDSRKRGLATEREQLLAEQQHVRDRLNQLTVSREKETEIAALTAQLQKSPETADFDLKRRLLEILEIRIDVIDKEHVRLSGIMCLDGIIVDV